MSVRRISSSLGYLRRLGSLSRSVRLTRPVVANGLCFQRVSIRFQHSNSKDPLGLQDFIKDLKEKESLSNESNETKNKEIDNDDPLGLRSILAEANQDIEQAKTGDASEILDSPRFEEEEVERTNSEADDQIDSFLESLNLTDNTNQKDSTSSRKPSQENTKDIIAQEQALFEDIFKSLNTNASYNTETNHQQIYKNLTNYKMTKAQMEMSDEEEKLNQVKEALAPTIEYIQTLDSQPKLIQEVNRLLLTTSELLKNTETYNEMFLSPLLNSQHEELIESIKNINVPHEQKLNVITLPIIFNEFLKVSNTKFKDGQMTLSFFNYLKDHLHLYLVICNQDTYNEILKTIWIFHGKSNLYQIETITTEMLNNGFQGNVSTFNILKRIITDYYNLKMNNYPLINNNLPIWNQEDDQRVSVLERKLRTISHHIKRST